MDREEAMERCDNALQELSKALQQGKSEALLRYLDFCGKFHRYSFRNQLLIAMQHPSASHVAGFQRWRELKRYVRKGEKGIAILAPMLAKSKQEGKAKPDSEKPDAPSAKDEKARTLYGFRIAYVFDITQTDGEAPPELVQRVEGDPGENLERLEQIVRSKGIELTYEASLDGALTMLGIEVSVRYHALGPSTFTGIAKRAWPNAACAILSHLLQMRDLSRPELDLVQRTLILQELPPFQDDQEKRSKYLLYQHVASRSSEMEAHFDLIQSNHNMDGPWGGVISRQVDFFIGIDRHKELASLVAKSLRDQVQNELIDLEANPSLIDGLRWLDESIPAPRMEVHAILDQAETMSQESILAAISAPPARHKFRIYVETAEGTEFDLERLTENFCATPQALAPFQYRLQLLATCAAKLQAEQAWVLNDLNAVTSEIEETEKGIERALVRADRKDFWHRQLVMSPDGVFGSLRDLHDRRATRLAERDAIERALAETLHVQSQHRLSLQQIENTLEQFVPRGSIRKIPDFVTAAPLAEVFSDLVALPQRQAWEQLDLLCGCARQVTTKGLAEILGEESDRLELLADRIVHGEYPVEGPPHGARRRSHPAQVFYVLPPMNETIEMELREKIHDRHESAKVIFYDTLAFGATVMRVSLFRFESVDEIFDGLLGHALKQAMDDPLAAFNAIDVKRGIESLSGKVIGNRVVFDDVDMPMPRS